MKVESKNTPLISSSFTLTYKVASLIFILTPRQTVPLAVISKDIIQARKHFKFGLTEAGIGSKYLFGSVMASNVDNILAPTVETAPILTPATPYLSISENSKNKINENTDSEYQKLPAAKKGNTIRDENGDTQINDSVLDPKRSTADTKCADTNNVALPLDKNSEKIVTFDNEYVPPEQALVTSVELVVPAAHMSTSEDHRPDMITESSLATLSTIGNKVQYSSGDLYHSSSSCDSTRILVDEKIDGCANNSSNLNIRIPTKLALTTTTTGDILLADRSSALWTPHHEQSREIHMTSDNKQGPGNISSSQLFQQQHRHSELLLQIEKESCEPASFIHTHSLPLQHHIAAVQGQYESAESQPILENHLQSNFYSQIMQQQTSHQNHRQNQQEESILESSPLLQQHASYAIYPHFQNPTIFTTHQTDDTHNQHQESHTHHMSCHSHSHPQPDSLSLEHQNQRQQQHLQQQQNLQHHQHQQHMHESYHDLIMEDFHDEPSSAYKLTLSPSIAKPENQDDGYETSAGDVLTPNSHSSSAHSVTPQHQMQHSNIGLMSQNSKKINITGPAPNSSQETVHAPQTQHEGTVSGISNQSASVDPYRFMGQELHSPANTNIETAAVASGNYAVPISVPNGSLEHTTDEIYQIRHQITNHLDPSSNMPSKPAPKKRGRKKKLLMDGVDVVSISKPISQIDNAGSNTMCKAIPSDSLQSLKPKERKKHDRFNGMTEEEVIKRTIPDHLCDNLDIVIVGINPGLFAAYKGHHYAGPGNHFWKCLYLAGLTQEQMSADEDHKLLKQGIGFTNMVARATKGSADLTRKEIKEGSRILLEKLQRFRPKVAVFNGKLIFEVFSGKKEFHFGRQPDRVDGTDTYIWVMPSSSARCAQLPRAADKVPFYAALKKFRDFLNGLIPQFDESECVFTEQRIRQCSEQNQTEASEKIGQSHQPGVSDNHSPLTFIDNNGGSGGVTGNCGNALACAEGQAQFLPHMFNATIVRSVDDHSSFPFTGGESSMLPGSNPNSTGVEDSSYLPVFVQQQTISQQPQEKKKRGRPKKIKGQEVIDHVTGNKVSISGQQMPHHDFNNILNLSMISGGGNTEMPKKKRGRPKKLKPSIDDVIGVKQIHHAKSASQSTGLSVSSVHSLSVEHMVQSPQSNHQIPPSLYNTPPPSHMIYNASASPMASPALNCNYPQVHGQGTPPVGQTSSIAQGTPPIIDPQNEQIPSQKQIQSRAVELGIDIRDQPNLGETPPPNSPNICTSVDFDGPEHSNTGVEQSKACVLAQQHQRIISESQYENSTHETELNPAHSQEHYQQWISSHSHHQSTQKLVNQQLTQPLIPYHQPSEHWQRYEDQNSNPYMLITPHHQHLSPRLSNESHQNPSHSGHIGSDVARKSLSGLESLVDQIPTIREHEPSATAAAAAAVESRLLSLQQQQTPQPKRHDNSVQEESCRPITENNVVNNSFSVSSLAASASNSTTDNETLYRNSAHSEGNRELTINNNNNCNNNVEYPLHGPSSYPHHASHLISGGGLGSGINGTEQNLHTHPMYVDPTHITNHMSHISPMNVNPVYGPTAYGSHPQHNTSNYATTHGHYSLGSPVPAAGPNSTSTIHMPSPNYPYGHHPYSHTPPQANYSNYPHPHSHHHTHHNHPPHHLSVFDRLKPSDIGGYGGF
ncbi:hypothetical protein KR018_008127 [Drosophila ironensis]|nr:hypothetical protein KR018_008127 [Drosophila ironensis]